MPISKNIFLTGERGVGKSTVLNKVLAELDIKVCGFRVSPIESRERHLVGKCGSREKAAISNSKVSLCSDTGYFAESETRGTSPFNVRESLEWAVPPDTGARQNLYVLRPINTTIQTPEDALIFTFDKEGKRRPNPDTFNILGAGILEECLCKGRENAEEYGRKDLKPMQECRHRSEESPHKNPKPPQESQHNKAGVIIMDELGIFEDSAETFKRYVHKCLDSRVLVLGAIKKKKCGFLDSVRERKDVLIIEVTPENRENIYLKLADMLGKHLGAASPMFPPNTAAETFRQNAKVSVTNPTALSNAVKGTPVNTDSLTHAKQGTPVNTDSLTHAKQGTPVNIDFLTHAKQGMPVNIAPLTYAAKVPHVNATALILAGGKSTRMGSDKALLPFGEETMLSRAVKELKKVFPEVIVSRGTANKYPSENMVSDALGEQYPAENLISNESVTEHPIENIVQIPDIYPDMGPLGGLHAGLAAAKYPYVFCTACDMPFIDAALAAYIVKCAQGFDIAVPMTGGLPQPLFAAYSKSCLPHIEDSLRKNIRKLTAFYENVKVNYINIPTNADDANPNDTFINVNTPEEYEKAKNKIQE